MNKLFISYRRSDAEDATGRIYDRLSSQYGRKNVFKDVDSIPFSVDFREYVKSSIVASRVTLVIIGRGWLNAQDEHGERRLDNPEDFVRLEVETALHTPNMTVIPVLVGRATMPPKGTLPNSLEQLIYRNASQVCPDPDFNNDLYDLICGLDPYIRKKWNHQLKALSTKYVLITSLLLLFIGVFIFEIFFYESIFKPRGNHKVVDTRAKTIEPLTKAANVYYASKPILLERRILDEVVSIAFSEAGNQESHLHYNSGPEIEKYLKVSGVEPGLGWCQAFIYWCFDQATKKYNVRNPVLKTGSINSFVVRANLQNVHVLKPKDARENPSLIKPGMIGCLYRENDNYFHAGIVVKADTNTVELVEGNTSVSGERDASAVYRRLRNFRKQNIIFVDFGHRNY